MKLPSLQCVARRGPASHADRGFTLPEVLIATFVFLILIGGVVTAHLFGLSLFRITETKLTAADDARKVIGKMADEIRTCKSTRVGSVNNGTFVGLLDGETQQGSSLLIYPTTSTNNYILYFVNPTDQSFRRTTSVPRQTYLLAESITNAVVFRAEDGQGNVLTNSQNNRVIRLNLEFYQPQRHLRPADYYKLETAVTRRSLE